MVLSGASCRHEWLKAVDPQKQQIICNKCGLYAYAMKPQTGRPEKIPREEAYAQNVL
jgi:hypothetical protein